ncbi:TOM1-like protein 9 [Rutidosis leptorrhynchoides]|uniref:TOM1-like protein 9 n=1 Tax=Rutidosis leptorrhynchoides TaxID=125765 RepID=UPI003A9956E8
MMNALVERATSQMLVGPDWSINIGICDICNRDPRHTKDVVKGIKKCLGSKNAKVQLLSLTLLETIVKNCGDYVHINIAQKALLRDMVKIVKKKPDFQVKEKILILIDTWQEAFGGARSKYPLYYAAYNELLHLGIIFPKKTERSPPVFTPLQTQPLKRNPQNGNEVAESSSAKAEFPTCLSMTEIQDARRIIGVLEEMLDSADPQTKVESTQEVVKELVMQCHTYKKRVGDLVNSTSDESLLRQGLSLNDDLQRVLNKHEAVVSKVPVTSDKLKPECSRALVPVDASVVHEKDVVHEKEKQNHESTPEKVKNMFDLLSGDYFSPTTSESSIVIAPLEKPLFNPNENQERTVPPQYESRSSSTNGSNSEPGEVYLKQSQYLPPQRRSTNPFESVPNMFPPQYEQTYPYIQEFTRTADEAYSCPPQQFPSKRGSFNQNGSLPNTVPLTSVYSQGSNPTWAGHISQQQRQCFSPVYGAETRHGLPHGEAHTVDSNQSDGMNYPRSQRLQICRDYNNNNHTTGMYAQHQITNNVPSPLSYNTIHLDQQFEGQQHMTRGWLPCQHMCYTCPHQHMHSDPMSQTYGYGGGYSCRSYGYTPLQNDQYFLDRRMSGLSLRDGGSQAVTAYVSPTPISNNASYVQMPFQKESVAEDKLFQDLVHFTNIRPNKTTAKTETMQL